MASDALRRLAARSSSTLSISGGYNGYGGYSSERSGFFCIQNARADGCSGYSPDPAVHAVPTSENALGTTKASKSLDVPGVPSVPAENDKGGNAARSAAEPEPPTQPDEPGLSLYSIRELDRWHEEQRNRRTGLDQDPLVRDLLQRLAEPGLSPYTIRELATWYEEEANRRRVFINIDQDALDDALRRLLAERGVLPEFISTEFERVMKVVFPGSAPNPKPDPHEKRIAALGDVADTVVNPLVRDVLRYGDRCPRCGAARWWNASDAPGWRCMTCNTPPIPIECQVRT
jgi:hypothetical protein